MCGTDVDLSCGCVFAHVSSWPSQSNSYYSVRANNRGAKTLLISVSWTFKRISFPSKIPVGIIFQISGFLNEQSAKFESLWFRPEQQLSDKRMPGVTIDILNLTKNCETSRNAKTQFKYYVMCKH